MVAMNEVPLAVYPGFQRACNDILDMRHRDARCQELSIVEHTIGTGGLGRQPHELSLIRKEIEVSVGNQMLLEQLRHPFRGNRARIDDIVDPRRYSACPTLQARVDELSKMRKAIRGRQQPRIGKDLAQIVSRGIAMIKGDAETPNVAIAAIRQDFLTESLGARVKAAIVGSKAKIRGIGFRKPRTIRACARVNAAAGNVSPRNGNHATRAGYPARQHGIGEQAFGTVRFASINIRLAGIASAIDEKGGTAILQLLRQPLGVIEVTMRTTDAVILDPSLFHHSNKLAPYISAGSKQYDQGYFVFVKFLGSSNLVSCSSAGSSTG